MKMSFWIGDSQINRPTDSDDLIAFNAVQFRIGFHFGVCVEFKWLKGLVGKWQQEKSTEFARIKTFIGFWFKYWIHEQTTNKRNANLLIKTASWSETTTTPSPYFDVTFFFVSSTGRWQEWNVNMTSNSNELFNKWSKSVNIIKIINLKIGTKYSEVCETHKPNAWNWIYKVPLDDANMDSMLYVNGECKSNYCMIDLYIYWTFELLQMQLTGIVHQMNDFEIYVYI